MCVTSVSVGYDAACVSLTSRRARSHTTYCTTRRIPAVRGDSTDSWPVVSPSLIVHKIARDSQTALLRYGSSLDLPLTAPQAATTVLNQCRIRASDYTQQWRFWCCYYRTCCCRGFRLRCLCLVFFILSHCSMIPMTVIRASLCMTRTHGKCCNLILYVFLFSFPFVFVCVYVYVRLRVC